MTDDMTPDAPRQSDLSRRQFLVRSAGIAGASFGLGVSRGGAAHGAAELRVGFLGVGERGLQLLPAFLGCEGVRAAAIADVAPPNRARALDVVRQRAPDSQPLVTESAERLLELVGRGALDAIVIATPPFRHAEHAVAALRAGAHVYLEKPMGLTLAESTEIRDEARRGRERGQVFQLGFQRRYNPRYLAGIEAIRSGRAGEILFVRAQWHNLGDPAGRKAWYYQREKSGDLLLEQSCHQLDVCNWVFDAHPARACGFGGTNRFVDEPPGRTIRDHYGLTLEYPCGGKVSYSQVSYAIPDRRFSGVYELVFGTRLGIDLWNGLAWDRSGKTVSLGAPGGNDTRIAVESFVDHVRRGEESRAGADVGFEATVSALLCLEALDTGRVVDWHA